MLFSGIDVAGVDLQPIENGERENSLFFLTYLLIIQIIIMATVVGNVGIVIDRFNTASSKGILIERQRSFKLNYNNSQRDKDQKLAVSGL